MLRAGMRWCFAAVLALAATCVAGRAHAYYVVGLDGDGMRACLTLPGCETPLTLCTGSLTTVDGVAVGRTITGHCLALEQMGGGGAELVCVPADASVTAFCCAAGDVSSCPRLFGDPSGCQPADADGISLCDYPTGAFPPDSCPVRTAFACFANACGGSSLAAGDCDGDCVPNAADPEPCTPPTTPPLCTCDGPDAGTTDAGTTDAGSEDAGTTDAGGKDAGTPTAAQGFRGGGGCTCSAGRGDARRALALGALVALALGLRRRRRRASHEP